MSDLAQMGGQFAEEIAFDLLSTAQAWRMLHDPATVGNLNAEAYLDLCLDAGYGREASEKAAGEWALRRLRQDLPA